MEWKDTKFENFSISDNGDVFNKKTKRKLNNYIDWRGYHKVHLVNLKKNINVTAYPHRLVAEAFIPNPDNKPSVNHIDGVKTNNNKDNLEWTTQLENTRHAIAIGLFDPIENSKKGRDASIESCSKKIKVTHDDNELKEYVGDNIVFSSIEECSRILKISNRTISRRTKDNKEYKGYIFQII